jgi:hypothetical protein
LYLFFYLTDASIHRSDAFTKQHKKLTLFSLRNEFLATLSYVQSYLSFQELHSITSSLLSVSTCFMLMALVKRRSTSFSFLFGSILANSDFLFCLLCLVQTSNYVRTQLPSRAARSRDSCGEFIG